ncbi:MAG: hypothetical protein MJK14_27515 [Rivularia sp. ALOHA_DT_140]|nr:hypothetical protein [Rivularia sp. ALOHA_DT_140]
MSRSRYGSRRLRYLKARLSILTRPSFLVAGVFVSVVGFMVKEYWTNPDFFKLSQIRQSLSSTSSSSESSLSEEDRAIAADIGNISVLDYDKQQANIPITTNINDNAKVKKENEAKLTKILDLAEKSQKANEIKPNTNIVEQANTPSPSQQNPFLKQAEDLLKFKFDNGTQNGTGNNLSTFYNSSQPSQNSFNLGINNSNLVNPKQSVNNESPLQRAINQSSQNKQIQQQEKSAENTTTEKKSSSNQKLLQNQTDSLVNTTIFNQPLNTPQQNTGNNFNNNLNNSNNNQFPRNNFNQPGLNTGLNNQPQNPYGNFNNNQIPTNNYSQPGLNNQLPNNFNNTQLPRNNYVQPTNPYNNFNNFNNNQQQNPYSNFNRNQLNPNNQQQNQFNNFNNNQIRSNRYSPEVQTRINNAYNRLINRELPGTVNRNNYTAPNYNTNTNPNIQQPNLQQFNSPYYQQNQIQYPNNGYRY